MTEPAAADPGPAADPQDPVQVHDPSGLGLAHTVAQAIGAQSVVRRRRKRPASTPVDPQVSGAHPGGRDPRVLGEALNRLVEAKGWATEVGVHSVLARWPALVGPTNAAHSQPESYVDTVLTVRADSTAWATSLRTMAPQLVAVLNEHLGEGTISRVKVLGPAGPSWKKGRLSVRDGRGPRDTYG